MRGVHEIVEGFGVGHVAGLGEDLAAAFRQFGAGRLERFHAARTDRDVGTFGGEQQRGAATDALARAGDDRLLAFESEIHGVLLGLVVVRIASGKDASGQIVVYHRAIVERKVSMKIITTDHFFYRNILKTIGR